MTDRIAGILGSLISAAGVAGLVAWAGAPTWGWLATGLIVYLVTMNG